LPAFDYMIDRPAACGSRPITTASTDGRLPDVATMNRAQHALHAVSGSRIPHVLHGWSHDGSRRKSRFASATCCPQCERRIRRYSATFDGEMLKDGNSIFISRSPASARISGT